MKEAMGCDWRKRKIKRLTVNFANSQKLDSSRDLNSRGHIYLPPSRPGKLNTQNITKWNRAMCVGEPMIEETIRGSVHCLPLRKLRWTYSQDLWLLTACPASSALSFCSTDSHEKHQNGDSNAQPRRLNSFWASARFSLGPGRVSQCWFP